MFCQKYYLIPSWRRLGGLEMDFMEFTEKTFTYLCKIVIKNVTILEDVCRRDEILKDLQAICYFGPGGVTGFFVFSH